MSKEQRAKINDLVKQGLSAKQLAAALQNAPKAKVTIITWGKRDGK